MTVNTRILVPHPYALNSGGNIGGLASVIETEAIQQSADLLFLTTDERAGSFAGHPVVPVFGHPVSMKPMSRRLWAVWALLHQESYTCLDEAGAQYVYGVPAAMQQSCLLRKIEDWRLTDEDIAFYEAFLEKIEALVRPGDVLNLQDFVWFPMLWLNEERIEAIKARGVRIVGTLHTHVPDTFPGTVGAKIVRALHCYDLLWTHCSDYGARVRKAVAEQYSSIPEIRPMHLGIDLQRFRGEESWPAEESTDATIWRWIEAKQQGKHVFVCLDRLDPIKGQHLLVKAVRQLFEDSGLSPQALREKYQVFFICLPPGDDDGSISYRYNAWADELIGSLCEDYPDIVLRGAPLKGLNRALLPHLLQNSVHVSGSTGDGLHLLTMEALCSNARDSDVCTGAAILASGAGFAKQAREAGFKDLFPSACVQDLVKAITRVTRLREESAGILQKEVSEVYKLVEKRSHSVLTSVR